MQPDDLNVTAAENTAVNDVVNVQIEVGSPAKPLHGFVAVLDALGAAVYSQQEADRFLDARAEITKLLREAAEDSFRVDRKDFRFFVFNDTIVVIYVKSPPTERDINGFFGLLRSFQVAFLGKGILFRGALSYGDLYRVDDTTNTVMGPAVSDAAAWYEKADWIGIHATPRATILIRSWLQGNPDAFKHVVVDYPVPLKDKGRMNLKAINWPKGLYLTQRKNLTVAKAALLSILGNVKSVPIGSESKHFHAIDFFDHCADTTFTKLAQSLNRRPRRVGA